MFFPELFSLGKQPIHELLHPNHDRIHQVGKKAAIQQRRDDIQKIKDQIIKAPQVGKNHPEYDPCDDHAERRQAPLHIFFIPMQLHTLSPCAGFSIKIPRSARNVKKHIEIICPRRNAPQAKVPAAQNALLSAECFDGVELGCLDGGQKAENDADQEGENHRHKDCRRAERRWGIHEL